MRNIRVILVDDSHVFRRTLKKILNTIKGIELVAEAPDPYLARDKIVLLDPDVIILDIEMPKMDGITFLKRIMKFFPKPVIIFSSLTTTGSKIALNALELGAVEIISKTEISIQSQDFKEELARKIRSASEAHLIKKDEIRSDKISLPLHYFNLNKIVVIGASTGGTEAIKEILIRLPERVPGIVIVQHMPAVFTKTFADRLNSLCKIKVKEAEENDKIKPGIALIAPGDYHVLIGNRQHHYFVKLNQKPRYNYQRPSVDILFKSAARELKKNAVGILLTGMGKDGASGLLEMRNAGASTIVQDKKTCVVYGMPEEAIRLNAAEYIEDIQRIPYRLAKILNK